MAHTTRTKVRTIPLARALQGLGRPVPRTCDEGTKVAVPGYKRCPPPKRILATVPLPGAKTSTTDATKARSDAREIERVAQQQAKDATADAKEAVKVAEAATEQRARVEKRAYTSLREMGVSTKVLDDAQRRMMASGARREARLAVEPVEGGKEIQQKIRDFTRDAPRGDRNAQREEHETLSQLFPTNPCTGATFAKYQPELSTGRRKEKWAEELRDCARASNLAGLGRTRAKGTRRCADAPKKMTKGCSELSFRKNLRHLVCKARKPQEQALAIAYSALSRACGIRDKKRRTVAQIVAHGKRKKKAR